MWSLKTGGLSRQVIPFVSPVVSVGKLYPYGPRQGDHVCNTSADQIHIQRFPFFDLVSEDIRVRNSSLFTRHQQTHSIYHGNCEEVLNTVWIVCIKMPRLSISLSSFEKIMVKILVFSPLQSLIKMDCLPDCAVLPIMQLFSFALVLIVCLNIQWMSSRVRKHCYRYYKIYPP